MTEIDYAIESFRKHLDGKDKAIDHAMADTIVSDFLRFNGYRPLADVYDKARADTAEVLLTYETK